jgi:hypothetical protein
VTSLFLRDEATGTSWQIWPATEPVPPGRVHEGGTYLFELQDPNAPVADLLIDDTPLVALRSLTSDTARWRWSPGFYAGAVEAELRRPGRRAQRFAILTDPDHRKLTRDGFNAMVREILEDSLALFALSGFRTRIAAGSRRPPPLARLEFLRSRMDELESVVDGIVRNPRRRLTAQQTVETYHRAARATGPEVLRSFRSGRILRQTGRQSHLPRALKGMLPQHIRFRRCITSLDLPEHRQMKSCLRRWAQWLETTADALEKVRRSKEDDTETGLKRSTEIWASRCRGMARRISQLAGARVFADSREVPPRLILSPLFRNDPLYRRFYDLWRDISLGLAAIFGDFLNMPLSRTFELYELWCFLRLVRAGAEIFGLQGFDTGGLFVRNAADGVTLATGAETVTFGTGWTFFFKRQYNEFWSSEDGHGSVSCGMIPDIVLTWEPQGRDGACRLIILDAKYRIEKGLNAALASIHAYRDALVRKTESDTTEPVVSAAWLLSPHAPKTSSHYRATSMPGRLFHPDYRTDFRFGAFTLRPGMSAAQIAATLQEIISVPTTVSAP